VEQKLSSQGTIIYHSPAESAGAAALPTVVFIHNMWGSHKVTLRHVRLMNRLGYNCATFDVYKSTSIKETLTLSFKKPIAFLYKDIVHQIEDVLDAIPGNKIIFGFSGPSLCGFIAAGPRTDVKAYICDGGPFKEIWECTLRMFEQQTQIPTRALKATATTASILYWGVHAFSHFHETMSDWPSNRPILSLRGADDPIVFPENIQHAFQDHPDLPLTIVTLKGVGHLDGLKNRPEDYEKAIKSFLLLN
jgi:pimeloyl-ACP methyl ester carboxylesterase